MSLPRSTGASSWVFCTSLWRPILLRKASGDSEDADWRPPWGRESCAFRTASWGSGSGALGEEGWAAGGAAGASRIPALLHAGTPSARTPDPAGDKDWRLGPPFLAHRRGDEARRGSRAPASLPGPQPEQTRAAAAPRHLGAASRRVAGRASPRAAPACHLQGHPAPVAPPPRRPGPGRASPPPPFPGAALPRTPHPSRSARRPHRPAARPQHRTCCERGTSGAAIFVRTRPPERRRGGGGAVRAHWDGGGMRCARSPASAMTGPRASVQECTCADRNPELPHVRSFAVEGRGLEHSQP